jgi:hypothetical protein
LRATIYRDFEPYGGVAGFVANERLLDMAARKPDRGVASAVSEHWEFLSMQDFSSAFRKRCGIAPSGGVGLR